MNIKSKVNIITNSSSECFSVKDQGNTFEVATKWYKFLEDNYKDEYGTPDNPAYSGVYDASIYEQNGRIFIDYCVLSNIADSFEKLISCFGQNNVNYEG